ncbi:substrate-binding domain-containing protein [Lachnospiraceae bacterium 54-53]
MKRMISMLLISLLMLILCSCSNNGTVKEQSTISPAKTEQPVDEVHKSREMTDLADSLGITADNYPVIDGSTSTLVLVQAIYREMYGEESYADSTYPQKASKTVPSYRRLICGEVDMILVPYASDTVLEEAKNAGVELEFHKIASEALIFITSAENSAESITLDQVREIYLNYGIMNWSKLGGPDRELVPICRNSDSGSQSQMANLVLNNEEMHPDIQNNYVELTMEGMLELVAYYHGGGMSGTPTDSYALGYTLYTYLQQMDKDTGIGERLKILSINGIFPTIENIVNGDYPLADGYYAVVRSDLSKDHSARSIIAWLQGDDGSRVIENRGMTPSVR